jgi:uncharacterized membrane protein YhaH (DUF805 family)
MSKPTTNNHTKKEESITAEIVMSDTKKVLDLDKPNCIEEQAAKAEQERIARLKEAFIKDTVKFMAEFDYYTVHTRGDTPITPKTDFAKEFIKSLARCDGKVSRMDYFISCVALFVIYCVLCILWGVTIAEMDYMMAQYLWFFLCIPVTSRRLHDIGMSGWWQLIMLLPSPAVITIAGLFLLFKPGMKYSIHQEGKE